MARITIALGGNALQVQGSASATEQKAVAAETAKKLVDLVAAGNDLIVGHGNGPQVGAILLAEEAADSDETPAMPLETDGAMSQGQIGYWLQQAIGNELRLREIDKDVATVITQTIVDEADPAFASPSKPIGVFYSEIDAKKLAKTKNWTVKEDAGRGWRRVVASPKPIDIVEKRVIKGLVNGGAMVVAAGGGGIPVFAKSGGELVGVDAVIDKDFGVEKLAELTESSVFLVLTAVDAVTINYKQPNETAIRETSAAELEKYADDGQFAPGSMLPKVQAAVKFAKARPENIAIITSINSAEKALKGEAGTIIRG
jgi:carbamate kinase